jgi:hypothetical protein
MKMPRQPASHPWKSTALAIIKNRPQPQPFISTQTHVSDVMDAIPSMRVGMALSHRTMEHI